VFGRFFQVYAAGREMNSVTIGHTGKETDVSLRYSIVRRNILEGGCDYCGALKT
jgi:hypothetical protein